MAEPNELSLAEFWKALAIATAIVAVFATIFVLSGYYNVSAQKPHFDVTTWLLGQVRRQSIRNQSDTVPPVPGNLQDADLINLGAVQYQLGCAACHGTPGWAGSPVGDAMLPAPPPLTRAAEEWSARELFWIVRNGQKYTGMPAWIAYEREDEVWPLVAFLEQLPGLGQDEYRRLTGDRSSTPGFSLSTGRAVIEVCARCQGLRGNLCNDTR
ncbi:MAG: cytochrome c [Rhizobiales bacterium]|nr:cytochrome c [Hyphomicrobiales bacterium]